MVLEKQCKRPSSKIAINIIYTAILITGASFPLKKKKSGLVLFIFNFKTKVTREERWGKHVFLNHIFLEIKEKALISTLAWESGCCRCRAKREKRLHHWEWAKHGPKGRNPDPAATPGSGRLLSQRRGSRRSHQVPRRSIPGQ